MVKLESEKSFVVRYMPSERSLLVETFFKRLWLGYPKEFDIIETRIKALSEVLDEEAYRVTIAELDIILALLRLEEKEIASRLKGNEIITEQIEKI